MFMAGDVVGSGCTKEGNVDLLDIWGASGTDVYAVGHWGTILHFDGKTWKAQDSGSNSILATVWGPSGSEVYTAGTHGTLLHYRHPWRRRTILQY